MNPSIPRDARLNAATVSRAPEHGAKASRMADYIADVVFIALLAAPFLIFEAPASIHDAVTAGAERPAIVSPTASAHASPSIAAPAAPVDDAYGPE
jgi:hypothetical protein